MKAKILYIEDNAQNFYLVNFLLSAAGHEVVWARDGRQGLAEAGLGKFDLILLDIQLPEMDGYAVARELRANRDLASVKIVALTSYAMTGDREKALEAGCDGYIEKPLDPKLFSGQVRGYLPGDRGKGK